MMRQFMKPERIRIIAVLAIFNYIFLGSEYLFDNMIRYATDSAGVVRAQNYVLGISVIGFLLFPCINRYFNQKMREIGLYLLPIAGIICIFVIQEHLSYRSMLLSGFLLYILYGIIGSAVHYYAAVSLSAEKGLAKTVGFGYAFGLLLQFISNNLIHNSTIESVTLSAFLAGMVLLVRRLRLECSRGKAETENFGIEADNADIQVEVQAKRRSLRHPMLAAMLLISIVVLMTCIFSSLDNAVTLVHAGGSVDIGQWPRLLLAVSGLLAGVLFDMNEHRFMQIMMYCVTLLSTMCVVIIVWGGPFMAGLVVFYLSAGFFVVYFTTSFMDLSYYMKVPELWAGLGRATNNICAGITGALSLMLIETGDGMRISIIALILFAVISVLVYLYMVQFRMDMQEENMAKMLEKEREKFLEDKFQAFVETYALTNREQDVLRLMLSSDESVQVIAEQLYISRAALYRYMASLNEKTETKSRIGLLQFYYSWKQP
ncbi:MAG: LuxR family transcriptional regulator [Lachnospiraceae bacterium]|nr:LuxR family transcriptional regulator [Lachnospiraceae bacterium]